MVVELPELHPNQARVKAEAARFNVVDCGRRFGKTVLAQDLLADTVLEGKPAAYFAPTYKMLTDVWRTTCNTLRPIATRVAASEHRIDIITGGSLDMWSLDSPDAPRGRMYQRVVIDEAAIVPGLENAWQAAIRPTLADMEGDAWFFSTPKGRNYFYRLWRRGGNESGWRSWQFPTHANPSIKRSEIEAMRAELPERTYQQEVEAAFLEDAGGVFHNVRACATLTAPDDPAAHKGHAIVIGCDWAKSQDFTVLTALCRECARVVDWDRFNQIDYTFQRARLAGMVARWPESQVLPERNSIGEPNIEMLRAENMPVMRGPDSKPGFMTLPTTKPMLVESLVLAIERGELRIPTDYADELESYEIEVGDSGRPRYGSPEGQHDDRVISLALAWYAASRVSQVWI
jgi:hypothetical protein